MDLSFLKTVEVKEVAAKAKASRISVAKTPVEGASFRVYKTGKIFTAEVIAKDWNLEFSSKEEVEEGGDLVIAGNGLDIFQSVDWQMITVPTPMLFVAVVPRHKNSKIDVYGSTTYNEDGSPKRSISSNTVSAFGKDFLIPALESIYGVNFEEVDYVDLVMQTEFPIVSPNNMYAIPKTVSRGENKGDLVYLTRKNINVFPLTVWEAPDVLQVDLEDSIEEVEKEKLPTLEPREAFETPNVDNNFSTNSSFK
jgi:hypothetical protein